MSDRIEAAKIPLPVLDALDALNAAGCEAVLVGGCVRDLLMGRTPNDFDVCTAALPEQTEAVFAGKRLIETGLKHGTVTVLVEGLPLEITTYRVDGSYSDSRRPDSVAFTPSLTEDLARRDFTVNAMAWSPSGGLVDPFGGQADLAAGLLRCVGEPERRFTEDALRILRALRFSATLGFSIDTETGNALRRLAERLEYVSAERVCSELCKLICGPKAANVILEYADVLGVVLPELLPLRSFDQRNPHHCYDALTHSVRAMEQLPPEPVLRWAGLLHDVAKPETFTLDEDGIGHFYGHPQRGAEKCDALCRRLRFDNAGRERVCELVRLHDRWIEPKEASVRRALSRMGPELFFQLMRLKRADVLALAPECRDRLAVYDRVEALANAQLAAGTALSLRELAVSGRDLLAIGYQPGPALGQALQALLDAVLDGSVENEKDALLRLAELRLSDDRPDDQPVGETLCGLPPKRFPPTPQRVIP